MQLFTHFENLFLTHPQTATWIYMYIDFSVSNLENQQHFTSVGVYIMFTINRTSKRCKPSLLFRGSRDERTPE